MGGGGGFRRGCGSAYKSLLPAAEDESSTAQSATVVRVTGLYGRVGTNANFPQSSVIRPVSVEALGTVCTVLIHPMEETTRFGAFSPFTCRDISADFAFLDT